MALVGDRIKETTTTTGSGNIALAGAVSGFQSFNTEFGLNHAFYYSLLDANGTAWETGQGYLSEATTLVRQQIMKSTNAGAAISLSSGTHTIFSTIISDMMADMMGKIITSASGWNMN